MNAPITLETLKEVPEGELPSFLWEPYLDRMQEVNPKSHSDWREFDLSFPRGIRIVKSVVHDLRCNNESSRRDYVLLESYLREHLDECVFQ